MSIVKEGLHVDLESNQSGIIIIIIIMIIMITILVFVKRFVKCEKTL